MHFLRFVILCVLCSALLPASAVSQNLMWKLTNFPYQAADVQGQLTALVTGPNKLIMAHSPMTLIASTTGGKPWAIFDREEIHRVAATSSGKIVVGSARGLHIKDNLSAPWRLLESEGTRLYAHRDFLCARVEGFDRDFVMASWDEGNTWDTLPAHFKRVTFVATQEHLTFIGTSDSLYLSSNQGDSWRSVPGDGANIIGSVSSLSGILFYGTNFQILFRTGDIALSAKQSLAAVGGVRRIIHIGTNTHMMLTDDPSQPIRQSVNEGQTWIPVGIGVAAATKVHDIAFSDYVLYVASDAGVYAGYNGEDPVDLLTSELVGRKAVRLLNAGGNRIYAASQNGELYRTTTHGDSWDSIYKVPSPVTMLGMSSQGSIFLASPQRLISSYDGGHSWHPSDNNLERRTASAFAVSPDGMIYLGTDSGLFVSTDEGAHWRRPASTRMVLLRPDNRLPPVLSLAVDSSGGLYVGTDGGILYSIDKGESYAGGWLQKVRVENVQVSRNKIVYVGSVGGGSFDTEKNFYVSRNILANDWVWPAFDVRRQSFATMSLNKRDQVVASVWLTPNQGTHWFNRSGNLNVETANADAQVLDDQDHLYLSFEGKLYRSEEPALSVRGSKKTGELITISPNPASYWIRFQLNAPGHLQIFSPLGVEMLRTAVGPGSELDVSSFPTGTYHCRITVNNTVHSASFIVLR